MRPGSLGIALRLVTRWVRGWGSGGVLFASSVVCLAAAVTLVSCQGTSVPRLGDLLPAPATPAPAGEPDVRVRIKARATSSRIEAPVRLIARPVGGGPPRALVPPLTITTSPAGVLVADSVGERAQFPAAADVEVLLSASTSGAGHLTVDGKPQPAPVTIVPRWRDGGQIFDLVATMPVETYIPGVLAKELFPSWPMQSFEAQAVAARSYALHERARARSSNRHFDLESDTRDQAYEGLTRLTAALEATRSTRGQVLTTRGPGPAGVLRAYYSSVCGGRASSAAEIWPTTNGLEFNLASPLQGLPRTHACTAAPLYRWETARKTDELTRRLKAWGREAGHRVASIDRLRSIDILRQNSAGRPVIYRVTDARGVSVTMTAEELRVACNTGVLSPTGAELFPPVRNGPTHVRGSDLDFLVRGDDVLIRGRGFGHGVGLCQYCAKSFAEQGMDYRSMLRIFYPGANLENAY
ncbi:MAG: SpoIID/LytB domain-containing protein [Phycisphaeraceae bacterium]|nr:MAG: SpoIID/LytB domain-containing protein [Phycisphaeraceae bacterium]